MQACGGPISNSDLQLTLVFCVAANKTTRTGVLVTVRGKFDLWVRIAHRRQVSAQGVSINLKSVQAREVREF